MLKQSDAFNTVFNSDQRTLAVKFTVADKDYTADDLTSIDYDSGAMTGESMGIGTAYENSVNITFANLIEGIKAQDQVTVSIGAQLPDGTFEYAPLGVFYVNDDISMDRNNNVTTITADDAMCKMEGVYTPKVTLPVSIADMVVDIANQTGVMVNSDNLSALPKNAVAELPKNQTYRTVLGWLAMMVPGYAAFDRDGKLCLKGITQPTYEVTPETYEFQGLTKNENPYTVAGIVIAQDDDYDYSATDDSGDTSTDAGTDDKAKSISVGATTGSIISTSNPLMTQDALNAAWKVIQPIQYYPYTLNWFGNPAVEAGDWLIVSDTAGNNFTVPNNSYTMTFDGGYSATSSTGESVTSSDTWDYNGTLNQTIKEVVRQTNASGTYSYFTVSDPVNPSEGDIWYKPNGKQVTLYIYSNGKWQPIVDDMTGQQIQQSVADAQVDIKTAKAVADAANTLATNNQTALQTKLGTDEFNTTVSQLNNDINLRVKTGDVISQINLEANQTLIESGKILLDAPTVTFSGNAFIPSAAIESLSADKITAGTIDANTINLIHLNANNISAGTIVGNDIIMSLDWGFLEVKNENDGSQVVLYDGQIHYRVKDAAVDNSLLSFSSVTTPNYWDLNWMADHALTLQSTSAIILMVQDTLTDKIALGKTGALEVKESGVHINSFPVSTQTNDGGKNFYNSIDVDSLRGVRTQTYGSMIQLNTAKVDNSTNTEIDMLTDNISITTNVATKNASSIYLDTSKIVVTGSTRFNNTISTYGGLIPSGSTSGLSVKVYDQYINRIPGIALGSNGANIVFLSDGNIVVMTGGSVWNLTDVIHSIGKGTTWP